MTTSHFANPASLVLTTKLNCPFVAESDLLPRPALELLFQQSRDKQLILLTASAGYGKSTLMAQWYRNLERERIPVAWLTLDEDDNDPGRLYNYLQLALKTNDQYEDSATTSLDNLRRVNKAHGALLAQLLEKPESPQVLFIDEFEALTNPEAQRLLQLLQQQMPVGRQLVIASRLKPGWPLSKLKLKGSLLELSDHELRFRIEEADALRTLKSAANLDEPLAQKLIEKTEGWIAGVRLALLCFAGRDNPEHWIEKISGAMSEITDFLTEEVYQHLSTEQQQFLLKISVPNRVCAPLCEAITYNADSQTLLDSFCEKGLFLQPLDERRHWYRLHGLVREFLHKRLQQEFPQQLQMVQGLSAQWLAAQGDVLEALHLAIEADQTLFACQLLESNVNYLVQQGELQTLNDLADRLPEEMLQQSPELMTGLCWSYIFIHDIERADKQLLRLKLLAKSHPEGSPLQAKLLTMEPMLLVYRDQAPQAAALALANLPILNEEDKFQRGVLANIAAYVKQGFDEFEESQQLQLLARACHLQSGSTYGLAYSDLISSMADHVAGKLTTARDHYAKIGEGSDYRAGNDSGIARAVSCGIEAELLYELDQLDDAEALLNQYFPIAIDNTTPDQVIVGHIVNARIAFARGHFETAYSRLDEGEVTGLRWPLPRLVNAMRWERVRFALLRGQQQAATTFAAKIPVLPSIESPDAFFHTVDAITASDLTPLRLMISSGESQQALDQLDKLIIESSRRPIRKLKLLGVKTLAHLKLNQIRDARRALTQALDQGREFGAIRSLIEEGTTIIEQIQALSNEWRAQPTELNKERLNYLDLLLNAAGAENQSTSDQFSPLAESLSDRELEILQLIGTGLKNDMIAEQLFLSVNTVKWHLRRAYEKLGVGSRSKALEQCRKRRLI